MNFARTTLLGLFIVAAVIGRAQVIAPAPVKEIKCSKAGVTCLAISPKGDRLLVGLDHGAELFDLESGKKIHTFPYSEDESNVVYHCAFNDNGEFVLLIGYSGKRQVYDVKTGKQEKVLADHRWVPTPGEVKAMGLTPANSAFDRFYQQSMAGHNDILTARAIKDGAVEFVDDEGTVMQTPSFPTNKDQHHRAPCLFHDAWFITGTDDGRVLFYTLL